MAKLYVWRFEFDINSAGGVAVKWNFQNNTEKTIKYASFWLTPYNAVNDKVECTIRHTSTVFTKFTGPLEPGNTSFQNVCENAWYNHTVSSISLDKVVIDYMDGTSETVYPSDISFSSPFDNGSSGGGGGGGCCYVATAVYGSYDCPEVWTLRRYRDDTLAKTWYGRAFVRIYYAISPTLVKWFGDTDWFKKMWKGKLDRMVAKLQEKGVESTPYEDKNW